jgi:hypothetical protein
VHLLAAVQVVHLAEHGEQALLLRKKPDLHVEQTVLEVHDLQLPEHAEQALLRT